MLDSDNILFNKKLCYQSICVERSIHKIKSTWAKNGVPFYMLIFLHKCPFIVEGKKQQLSLLKTEPGLSSSESGAG